MKRRAHICIDECVTGSYHRNSLEGLAAGCVVVNGLGLLPEVVEVFRRCAPTASTAPPFVRAGLGDLEAVLASLVERGATSLAREGAANRRWMEEHWDFRRQWESFWAPVVARARSRAGRARTTRSAPRGAVRDTPAPRANTRHATTNAGAHTPHNDNHASGHSTPTRLRLVSRSLTNSEREGVAVVIPHGGRERLPHLQTTLARLQKVAGVRSLVVVEMDDAPHARDAARRLADAYAFIRNDDGGPFHKARAMNAGLAFARAEVVLWLDNDLLLPPDFLTNALAEMHRRRLDCLVPWTSVRYLSREDTRRVFDGELTGVADCRHVNAYFTRQGACGGAVLVRRAFLERHGGMCEEFRGWGGEDNAWFYKARVLGAAAITAHREQHISHLFHENSGGYDATNHREKNPHYERNVALLYAIRRLNTRERLLARFPRPAHHTCPWDAARRIAFVVGNDDDTTSAAYETAEALRTLYGLNVGHFVCRSDDATNTATRVASFGNALDAALGCDALIVFDEKLTPRLLADEALKDARRKTIAVHRDAARVKTFSGAERELLRRAAAHLCVDEETARSLEEIGLNAWRAFGDASASGGDALALGLVQPLSLVLNGFDTPRDDTPDQRRLHLRAEDHPMNTSYAQPAPVRDLALAREDDLALTEYAAFNHGRDYPPMRRWELPFALFKSRLASTSSVLDCSADSSDFAARLHSLYPHALYRRHDPLAQHRYAPPIDVPDAAFDRAVSVSTLERLSAPQRESLVAELACKLKPGGLLVLTARVNPDTPRADADDLLRLSARHGLRPLAADETLTTHPTTDAGLCRDDGPRLCLGAVFVKDGAPPLLPKPKRIVLALLTWNTRDISLEALAALAREAATLKRLGHEASLVVCDNGSIDGTREALADIDAAVEVEHRFILNEENRGSSIARNRIIDHLLEAGGDYLLFTDGDIELVPFSSFAMLRHMEDSGRLLGCLGAHMYGQSPRREQTTASLYSLAEHQVRDEEVVAWTQYGLFRREVFEAGVRFDVAHPFDREGWGCEDNDLAFQMLVKGYRIQCFTGMTYLHRNMHSSMRLLRAQGFDPVSSYEARKRYVIQKWAGTPAIGGGPLKHVRIARAPTGS